MDKYTFIASLVAHLAWPTVVLLLVGYVLIAYRSEVKQFLVRLASLKAAGLEVQFKDQMKEIEAAVELPSNQTLIDSAKNLEPFSDALRLAEISPNAAILHTWIAVENALSDSVKRISKGHFKDLPSTPLRNIKWLEQQEYLAPPVLAKLGHLRAARNSIAHSQFPMATYEEARAYAELAEQVTNVLRNVSEM